MRGRERRVASSRARSALLLLVLAISCGPRVVDNTQLALAGIDESENVCAVDDDCALATCAQGCPGGVSVAVPKDLVDDAFHRSAIPECASAADLIDDAACDAVDAACDEGRCKLVVERLRR